MARPTPLRFLAPVWLEALEGVRVAVVGPGWPQGLRG